MLRPAPLLRGLAAAAAFAAILAGTAAALDRGADRSDEVLRDFLWDELRALPAGSRPKVGVVFSGGGARGFAHVGVIQVLDNADFPVDVVAGTSMGALVGVAYADGQPASQLRQLATHAHFADGTNFSSLRLVSMLLSDRLLSTRPILDYIKTHVGEKQFYELKKPFGCVATDIKTGEKIVFTDGEVASAVRASMNLPGVFEPVQYRQRYLVDGGVVDFIPVDVARQLGAQWVLASVVEGDYTRSELTNVFFTLAQVTDISGSILARRSKQAADFLIQPDVGQIKVWQLSRGKEAYEAGILAAQKRIRDAKDALILYSAASLAKAWGAR